MTLTHHPVRLFRLSCGCLREYPMMPAGTEHTVLCVTCRTTALTVLAYPERCCAVTGWALVEGRRLRVSCTVPLLHCHTILPAGHYDETVRMKFTAEVPRLAQSREGKTGRA